MKGNCFFEAKREGEILEVTLYGELDHHGAVRLRTDIDALLGRERPKKTVLNLSQIEFMDSSGLGLIMGRYAMMQRLGGELTLRRPHERLVKIFELAGLERMVRIETDEDTPNDEDGGEKKEDRQ